MFFGADAYVEEDLSAEELSEVVASCGADSLHPVAAVADQDPLLRLALDDEPCESRTSLDCTFSAFSVICTRAMKRRLNQSIDLREPDADATAVSGLTPFSSTALATAVGAVTREVMQRGAVVITKHDEPVMVLMSLERYVELERAGAPDLNLLTDRFDELYARMQAPGVAEKSIAALDLQKAGSSSPRPARPHPRRHG